MSALIRRGVDRVLKFLLRKVAGKLVAFPVRRRLAQFEAATHRPREVQDALLQGILAHHAATDFARVHRFDTIHTTADFRRQMPVADYDYFEPYIARVRKGEFNALLGDAVVHMFALTSGTTATRKYIPVTPRYLADYKRGWNLWGLRVFQDHKEVTLQPIVQMSGDWDEYRTEAGIPCGAVTGLTALMQKRIVRWVYCVPPCCARIKDAAAKYYVALRLSLPRPVGLFIAANPSTVINFARAGDAEKESLIRDIADGTLNPRLDIPPDVYNELKRRLRPNPERARELQQIADKTGTLYPSQYWPRKCLLGNWTGGSVSAYLRHYPRYYGSHPVRDVGLIASEGRMTIPMTEGSPAGILDVTTHYFEFIPEAEGDSPKPTILAAHELQEGSRYFILLTTSYGLYRYHIHDLVRVTGFHNRTPLIEFLSKGAHFSNLTGEKLSEYQVTHAMAKVLGELSLSLTSYSVAPCWNDEQPYYGLFLERGDLPDASAGERLAARLDARLRETNVEYAAKRDSLRLGALRLETVGNGFWAQWDRERLQRNGGTMEQYKHPCLINDLQFARHSGGSTNNRNKDRNEQF
jgi:GH3 auxin-responsive promoter